MGGGEVEGTRSIFSKIVQWSKTSPIQSFILTCPFNLILLLLLSDRKVFFFQPTERIATIDNSFEALSKRTVISYIFVR